MKRLLSVVLAVTLVFTSFSFAYAEETGGINEVSKANETESANGVSNANDIAPGDKPAGLVSGGEENAAPEEVPEIDEDGNIPITIAYINPEYADIFDENAAEETEPEVEAASFYSSTSSAAKALRSKLVARSSSFTISFNMSGTMADGTLTNAKITSKIKSIYATAVKHTGVSNQGDYLKWHMSGMQYGGGVTQISSSKSRCDIVFYPSYLTTASEENYVTSRVKTILSQIIPDGASDYEKISRIYEYITTHVSYDYNGLKYNDPLCHSAYAAVKTGKAVCQGYASLLYRMALLEGIPARLVAAYEYTGEGHGWNIVKVAGKYYYVDSTWDSEADDSRYFLRGTSDFYDHNNYVDLTQMVDNYTMSKTRYSADHADHAHNYVYSSSYNDSCLDSGAEKWKCTYCDDYFIKNMHYSHTTGSSYNTLRKASVFKVGKRLRWCNVCLDPVVTSTSKLTPTIKLSATSKTIRKGSKYYLKITKEYGDYVVSCKSSNTSVVGVVKVSSTKYKLKAKKKGKATVTVKLKSGKKAKCTVTVK